MEALFAAVGFKKPAAVVQSRRSRLAEPTPAPRADLWISSVSGSATLLPNATLPPQTASAPALHGGAHHRRAHSTAASGPLRLSDLELLHELGEGSFAQVVACRRRGAAHLFALKVMHKRALLSRANAHHALAEKAALAACRSPHVVTLYYALSDDEHWCLLLELCAQGDLHSAIQRGGVLSAPSAAWLCAEVASGLAHLHAAGWCHRDVKPENIGLSASGHAKLLDLGTACKLGGGAATSAAAPASAPAGAPPDGADEPRAAERRTAGTAAYCSPEVIGGAPGDECSDLWGLGCVLFACLAGSSPFAAPTEYASLRAASDAAYAWPRGGVAPPAACVRAVAALLEPEPARRRALGQPQAAEEPAQHAGSGSWLVAFRRLECIAQLPAPPCALHALTPPPLRVVAAAGVGEAPPAPPARAVGAARPTAAMLLTSDAAAQRAPADDDGRSNGGGARADAAQPAPRAPHGEAGGAVAAAGMAVSESGPSRGVGLLVRRNSSWHALVGNSPGKASAEAEPRSPAE
jgi:hypothetical protein